MTTQTLRDVILEQIDRVFDAQAAVMLSSRRLDAFSGDEDSEDIVSELSTVSHGLGAATELLSGIANALEVALREGGEPRETEEPAADTAETKPSADVVASIERQRESLFRVTDLITVMGKACEDDSSERVVLEIAVEMLESINGSMELIGRGVSQEGAP